MLNINGYKIQRLKLLFNEHVRYNVTKGFLLIQL
jgi:hypothetical protein